METLNYITACPTGDVLLQLGSLTMEPPAAPRTTFNRPIISRQYSICYMDTSAYPEETRNGIYNTQPRPMFPQEPNLSDWIHSQHDLQGYKLQILASSKALAGVSSGFEKYFRSIQAPRNQKVMHKLQLRDNELRAMEILMCLIHGLKWLVPLQNDIETLTQIATLMQRYEMDIFIDIPYYKPVWQNWAEQTCKLYPWGSNIEFLPYRAFDPPVFLSLLCISWIFNLSELFNVATRWYHLSSEWNMTQLMSNSQIELPFSGELIEALNYMHNETIAFRLQQQQIHNLGFQPAFGYPVGGVEDQHNIIEPQSPTSNGLDLARFKQLINVHLYPERPIRRLNLQQIIQQEAEHYTPPAMHENARGHQLALQNVQLAGENELAGKSELAGGNENWQGLEWQAEQSFEDMLLEAQEWQSGIDWSSEQAAQLQAMPY